MLSDVSIGGKFSSDWKGDFSLGKQIVFIELRAGSAVLSAAAQWIVSLDLSEDHAWDVFT